MKYLVDTCVWRDFYENRLSKTGKPIGKQAHDFFINAIKNKDKIFFSEVLTIELSKDYSVEEINEMLNILFLNGILSKIDITKDESLEAEKLSLSRNLPFADCLNAIQARNNNAVLISQDKHFFKYLSDIAITKKPNQIGF